MATREVVGWGMADHLRAGLCLDALVMALQRCRPPRGLVHHSDQGVQGRFKRSSQQLEGGRLRWQVGGGRIGPYGAS